MDPVKRKGKIFFITTEFPPGPGGIGSHAHSVINELHKLGWEFLILTNQEYTDAEKIKRFNENYHSEIITLWKTPSLRQLILKIRFIIKKAKEITPDLIVSTGRHAVLFGFFVKLFTRVPFITIGHGSEFGVQTFWKKKVNRLKYGSSDLLITVSNYTKEYAISQKIKPKNIIVIYNGADETVFRPLDDKDILSFKKMKNIISQRIILSVGTVSERKGQLNIIKSLPYILSEFPETHYYSIGMPFNAERFMKIASELNVEKNVHFLGNIDNEEMVKWYNACDIFAMTSSHTDYGDFEGFGIAVIEAALCKKPAIVTNNTSGVIESIVDGITGIGVQDKDFKEISKKIIDAFNDSKKLDFLGKNAYDRAINEYTWKIKAKEFDRVFSKLIE